MVSCKASMDCCSQVKPMKGEYRAVQFGEGSNKDTVEAIQMDNSIVTSKYTFFNFLPKNIFEQFRRLANIYFLILSILMLIGDNVPRAFQTPVNPYSTLGTLAVVMTITLVKDGYEDIGRHRSDRHANHATVKVVSGDSGAVIEKKSAELRVGDLVMIQNREGLPADIILLATSDDENQCYVETSNIDGETNLKLRSTPGNLGEIFPTLESFNGGVKGSFECEHPNENIHSFNARINVVPGMNREIQSEGNTDNGEFPASEPVPVSIKNLLIRGSVLRNTAWAIGVIVYTGKETKIMMNMRKVPSKLSSLERTVNKIIKLVFAGLAIFVLVSVIYGAISRHLLSTGQFYTRVTDGLPVDQTPRYLHSEGDVDLLLPRWLGDIFSFLILYSNMVPISLYVTIELINVAQAYFISNDIEMYYEDEDVRATCRNSSLCQELGQVSYVFSDKTGTLTQNVMKFNTCVLASGSMYNAEQVESELFNSNDLARLIRMMAVCHTVVPEHADHGAESTNESVQGGNASSNDIVYQSESPDEGALVKAAAEFGFMLTARKKTSITVIESSTTVEYEILAVNTFNSTRKRMSVVVRFPDNSIHLLCKGADNVILERCDIDHETLSKFNESLDDLAASGLRTLAFAVKELSRQEYDSWITTFDAANASLDDRAGELDKAAEAIETGMTLLGGTGIEDKLQDGVPETINEIRSAGVKLWVLTGDKVATAINIGKSCNVIQHDSLPVALRSSSEQDLTNDLTVLLQAVGLDPTGSPLSESLHCKSNSTLLDSLSSEQPIQKTDGQSSPHDNNNDGSSGSRKLKSIGLVNSSFRTSTVLQPTQLRAATHAGSVNTKNLVLVLDGPALTVIMGCKTLRDMLLAFSAECKSVIACRISPKQKAQIVRMVRKGVKPQPVTLAIGDGANDVTMIQEAHLGVGISGKEGRQAVNNSDFAVGQFRYLSRLMLVHGRWNYRRMSKIVLLCFYKNICLVTVLVLFNLFTLMSGTSLFDSWVYSGFNFFSGMPPVLIGMFDKELTVKQFESMTYLYTVGVQGLNLNYWKMSFWMGRAIAHAIIIAFMSFSVYGLFDSSVKEQIQVLTLEQVSGTTSLDVELGGLQAFGVVVYTSIYFVVMMTIGFETATWNFFVYFFFYGSILFYIASMFVLSSLPVYLEFHNVTQVALFHPLNWVLAFLVTVTCLALDLTVRGTKRHFFHSDLMRTYQKYQNTQKDTDIDLREIKTLHAEAPNLNVQIESRPLVPRRTSTESVDGDVTNIVSEGPHEALDVDVRTIDASGETFLTIEASSDLGDDRQDGGTGDDQGDERTVTLA